MKNWTFTSCYIWAAAPLWPTVHWNRSVTIIIYLLATEADKVEAQFFSFFTWQRDKLGKLPWQESVVQVLLFLLFMTPDRDIIYRET